MCARMNELVAKGDNAGAIKHFMRNGVRDPGVRRVHPDELMGMMRKFAPVAPTLPYDTALTAPFQLGEPLPKGRWPKATMPVLDIGGGKSDALDAECAGRDFKGPAQRLAQDTAGPEPYGGANRHRAR